MSQKRILHHLQQLVSLYPASYDQDAVLAVIEYCRAIIDKSGAFQDSLVHSNEGYHSLTASTRRTKTPKLLLQAHIDVVPAPEALQALTVAGDKLSGRGVYDMLFAAACYLAFIEEHAAELSKLDMGIMLTGDEELGGFHGVKYLLEQGYGCQVCILPDAGHGFGDLNVSAKGIFNFDVVVKGRAHHGSRPWEGDGAANKLVHLLHELIGLFDLSDRENSTLTVTRLEAGDSDNKGPSEARAHLDIRYKDDADYHRLEAEISALVKRYDGRLEQISLGDDYKLDANNAYVQEFLELYEAQIGQPITQSKAHGSSDARFFAAQGIPVIMLRPDGTGAHADQETLSLPSLEAFYALFETYVLQTARIEV